MMRTLQSELLVKFGVAARLWSGTAEQLIEAGLLSRETMQALAQPQPRGKRRPPIVTLSGRPAQVRRYGRRWQLYEELTEEERQQAESAEAARRERERQAKRYGTAQRARQTARGDMMQGLFAVASAFNLTALTSIEGVEVRPYRFDEATQRQAFELLAALRALFECGRMELLAPALRDPGSDAALQRLLRQVLR
jgi:hypothetical protein